MAHLNSISQSRAALIKGQVLVYPTETVWGLGVDVTLEKHLQKIFDLKGRDSKKAVSILVRDLAMAQKWVYVDKRVEKLMEIFWPGPVTFVLKAQAKVPKEISENGFVGVRCSSFPWLRELMAEYHNPITTTSANKSGSAAALSLSDLKWLEGEKDVVIAEGPQLVESQGSTVVKITDQLELLRQGEIDFDLIEKAFGLARDITSSTGF